MALSSDHLKSLLLEYIFNDPPLSPSDIATAWKSILVSYISNLTSPRSATISGTIIIYAEVMEEALIKTHEELNPLVKTPLSVIFAPVDVFFAALITDTSIASQISAGAVIYSIQPIFGKYAFSGVDNIESTEEAAKKIADNIHSHIISTPTNPTAPIPWE